jgi:hypothetical protein
MRVMSTVAFLVLSLQRARSREHVCTDAAAASKLHDCCVEAAVLQCMRLVRTHQQQYRLYSFIAVSLTSTSSLNINLTTSKAGLAGSRKAAAAAAATDEAAAAAAAADSPTTAVKKAGSRGVRFGSDDSSVSGAATAAATGATTSGSGGSALSPKGAGHGRSPSVKDLANVFSKVSCTITHYPLISRLQHPYRSCAIAAARHSP